MTRRMTHPTTARRLRTAGLGLAAAGLLLVALAAAEPLQGAKKKDDGLGYTDTPLVPGQKWHVHDRNRPHPSVVTPPMPPREDPPAPPSDAVVLFDGTDLDAWTTRKKGEVRPAGWKVVDGYMQAVPGSGSIWSKPQFGDCQIHLEWAAPTPPKGSAQGRGNSGVIIMGRYEIQVLDNYKNPTYADGHAGAVYGQHPPLVDACRPPGRWQTYDIVFEAPRFEDGQLKRPAYVTVFHNGVLVQNHTEILGPVRWKKAPTYRPHPPKGPLMLQEHGNPVRYRNVWVRPLDGEE